MAEIKGLNKNATRMLTGLVMGTIAMACIMQGKLALVGLLLFILYFATREYVQILNNKGFYPSVKMIYIAGVLLAIIAYFQRFDLVTVALTFSAIATFMWILFKGRQPYIANVATTVLGMIYCVWFPLHLLFLRNLECVRFSDGLGFVVMMFAAVLLTDTGCYYVGTHFGKHKLAPVISPNKTVEGSIGGVICAVIGSMIIGWFIGLEWYLSCIAGLLCTAFAQIGDLSESLIKRDAGVKDSGDILPGHGGMLDRFDGWIYALPLVWLTML